MTGLNSLQVPDAWSRWLPGETGAAETGGLGVPAAAGAARVPGSLRRPRPDLGHCAGPRDRDRATVTAGAATDCQWPGPPAAGTASRRVGPSVTVTVTGGAPGQWRLSSHPGPGRGRPGGRTTVPGGHAA